MGRVRARARAGRRGVVIVVKIMKMAITVVAMMKKIAVQGLVGVMPASPFVRASACARARAGEAR